MTTQDFQPTTSSADVLGEDKTVQKWLNGVERSCATEEKGTTTIVPGTTGSETSEASGSQSSKTSVSGPSPISGSESDDRSSAPAIPPKSPLRKPKTAPAPYDPNFDPIPQDIVARTQGRVKRFTASLEEKPNIYMKQFTVEIAVEEWDKKMAEKKEAQRKAQKKARGESYEEKQ